LLIIRLLKGSGKGVKYCCEMLGFQAAKVPACFFAEAKSKNLPKPKAKAGGMKR
jgi:hypothetical protein